MRKILYEAHREGWWSELKGEQKAQGQSFEGSGDTVVSRTENNILCSVLKYAGF